jgi:hypothetical protein
MPMDKRIEKLNSNYQANYYERLYATPYVVEKEVMPTCSTPYASCNFHDSVPYDSNDYSRINEHSSNLSHLHMLLYLTICPLLQLHMLLKIIAE